MFRRPVRLVETINDDELSAIIDGQTITTGIRGFAGTESEWDALIAFFRSRGHPARLGTPVRVWTIEISRDVPDEPPGQMFYEACAPCTVPAAHVIDGRRVIGVFASRSAASHALGWLRTRGIEGRVTPL